jgi:uncharacterized protein YjbI with pentapeptide repeats
MDRRHLEGAVFDRADLRKADFEGAHVQGASFFRTQLKGAVLLHAHLQGASLEGAQLEGHSLDHAELQGASLMGAQLQGAALDYAQLQGASLDNAQLRGATLREAQLQGASLQNAQLRGATLGWAKLQGATLDKAQLQGATLREAKLQGASLDRAQLQGASLDDAQLQGASLQNAQLQGARFLRSTFFATNMRYASVWRTSFENASLTGVFLNDRLGESAISKDNFVPFQAMIMNEVPEGLARANALKRIEILNPDIFGPDASEQETLEKGRVDETAHRKSLADQLKGLACSRDEDALHIVRGLIRRDSIIHSPSRIESTSTQALTLVEAILKPDCPVSAALTDADKAALRKLSADEMQELVCSGDNNALNILRGFLKDGHIKGTGAHASDLVEAILKPDCPVSAALTETDKAALKKIAKETSGAP